MLLDRVTITGADDSVDPQSLKDFQREFNFVEWGILLSRKHEGKTPRFPSRVWINKLVEGYEHLKYPPRLSGHICGRWVRDICVGEWKLTVERPDYSGFFDRFQLNFHGQQQKVKQHEFIRCLMDVVDSKRGWGLPLPQFIFQMDGVNDLLLTNCRLQGLDAVPLFDLSGGAGILPDRWPEPIEGVYCGYAGGLSPDNVVEQLERIEGVAPNTRVWIDVETHVRSNERFDLEKVHKFLELTKPWVDKCQDPKQ